VAAALVAVGLAAATPDSQGATTALGTALTTHGSSGTVPLAQISVDPQASRRTQDGSPAPHQALAPGVAPVAATGRTILASGLAAALVAPARSGRSTSAHSGNQVPSSHPAQAAKHVHHAAPAHRAKAAHRAHLASARHTGPCATSTLHWWICAAEHALEQHGVSRGRLSTNAAYIVVQHESGANPHAYNGWDSNAAAGHPSEGIAQVIGPTFRAYALAGHHNIWNPVDNMIAAFRYAISRYGSMNNIPGVVGVRQGGSYVGY
jgi:hypothetical protein